MKLPCKTPTSGGNAIAALDQLSSTVLTPNYLCRKHIKESIEVTQYYRREMPIEHGRNLFKLSEALLQVGDDVSAGAEATSCRDEAAICLKKKNKGLTDSGLESSYDDLIPVYWR